MAKSDEFLNWFDDNYEKTDNNKDIIKLKVVYENFKASEYFNNLNKVQKGKIIIKTSLKNAKQYVFKEICYRRPHTHKLNY